LEDSQPDLSHTDRYEMAFEYTRCTNYCTYYTYDTDHCLVVAKVTGRLEVSKQTAQTFDGGRFYLRQLNELEVRNQYQIEIINKFASLENLTDVEDINRAWENIKKNIKTSAK